MVEKTMKNVNSVGDDTAKAQETITEKQSLSGLDRRNRIRRKAMRLPGTPDETRSKTTSPTADAVKPLAFQGTMKPAIYIWYDNHYELPELVLQVGDQCDDGSYELEGELFFGRFCADYSQEQLPVTFEMDCQVLDVTDGRPNELEQILFPKPAGDGRRRDHFPGFMDRDGRITLARILVPLDYKPDPSGPWFQNVLRTLPLGPLPDGCTEVSVCIEYELKDLKFTWQW